MNRLMEMKQNLRDINIQLYLKRHEVIKSKKFYLGRRVNTLHLNKLISDHFAFANMTTPQLKTHKIMNHSDMNVELRDQYLDTLESLEILLDYVK